MRVLIVDDHAPARRLIAGCLAPLANLEILEATSLDTARQVLAQHLVDVALIDLRLDGRDQTNQDGMILVKELRDLGTAVPVVVTASSDMKAVRAAMRAGAYAYILKDELSEELVLPVLRELQSHRALAREVLRLHGLVGTSPAMERLRRLIKKVAAADVPVLILGPTGSGKELVARSIHTLSSRRAQSLVTVNCGAFTESLVESQLFGYEKGFFTGADRAHPGYLTEAGSGTLFLDEVAELPALLQTKLLRVLENRTYRSIGATADSRFEGRLLAATHVELASRAEQGFFRRDLFYRLEVLTIRVPSLDERKEDIPALVEHLIKELPHPVRFAEDALAKLAELDWPGNVRQLRNLIHRLVVFGERDLITADDVGQHRTSHPSDGVQGMTLAQPVSRLLGEELLRGLSPTAPFRENRVRLAQNQIRSLEEKGHDVDEICKIMGLVRSSFFRLRSGSE